MTTIRIPGVKGYVSNGTPYFYLRATGARIVDPATNKPIDPHSDPAAFVARVEAMKRDLAALPKPITAKAGTLLALVEAWRGVPGKKGLAPARAPSPEWLELKPATRRSYERIVDPETGYLRRALKRPLDEIWLTAIDQPNVVAIRDRVARRFGWWTGNYAVTVLRLMFRWGKLHGHMEANPAEGVPKLKRPADLPDQHPSWTDPEFEAMYTEARRRGWKGVALGLALGRFAGWPIGDIINQPRTAWQDPRLVYVRHKSRQRRVNSVAAPDRLREIILELLPPAGAKRLVVNQAGEPYTEDGMRTMVWRLCSELAKAGAVRAGLNIHGLRHSLGKELYDLGLERDVRKAMIAHVSDQASMVYERDGDRAAAADRAVVALNRKHRRRRQQAQ